MKKFSESTIGIILLSGIPSFAFYVTMINESMDKIIIHIASHWPAYTALLLSFILAGILTIKRHLSKREEKILLLVKYTELLHEEIHTRLKNNEFVENNWRKTLVDALNQHFKNAQYKQGVSGQSDISIEIRDSESESFFKEEKLADLQRRMNELRDKLS